MWNDEDKIKCALYHNAINCVFDSLQTSGLGMPLPIFTVSEVFLNWVFGLISGKRHQIIHTVT